MSAGDAFRKAAIRFGKSPEEADVFVTQKVAEVGEVVRRIRATVLLDAADHLVAYCPRHGAKDTAFVACQCMAAEELRRMAGTGGAQ
jgi:hypothetical protein